jgi:cyanophycinase
MDFDYYLACGNKDEVSISPQPGILLIGGAEGDKSGEHEATQWFLARAKGGKYLVLRTGGIGGQAQWICQHYRDWVHSAAELSVDSREAANDPKVIDYIRAADALFIAGGDQTKYKENSRRWDKCRDGYFRKLLLCP